jgi:superfamily I DNA/RNA helicase
MGKFVPSTFQTKIFDFIQHGNGNAVISAVAGSGKTTTLINALKLIPTDKTILFLAFNKSISNELKERVPKTDNIHVKTVHGFGYNTIRLINDVTIDNHKYRKLFRDVVDSYTTKNPKLLDKYNFNREQLDDVSKMFHTLKLEEVNYNDFVSNVINLCNLGRLHLIDVNAKVPGVMELNDLSEIHTIPNEDGESSVAWYLIKLGLHYNSVVDYTDMVSLPNILDLPTETYDYVFIDECQDLNTCQRLLMQKSIKPETGRFIAVGDPKQAIYAFAGADYESYQKLCNIPNTIQLPLSVTYRCSPLIVDRVRHINPDIEPLEGSDLGVVFNDFSYKDVKDGDMILCRQTFPVVSLCIKYITEGRKAYIIGSDISLSLVTMINNCQRKTEEFTMENVFCRLYDEKSKLIDKVVSNHKMSRSEAESQSHVIMFNEKIQVIEALSEGLTNPLEVINKIQTIFSDTKKVGICLSNIHKSKGLESDRVFILQPELMPSKYAKLDWQIEQEDNLKYVAYTRAKSTLGFITDYDAWEQHKSRKDTVKKPSESKHIGSVGMKMRFNLRVISKKTINGPYGESIVYEMVDDKGNVFSKFGDIKREFIVGSMSGEVDVNTNVSFYGIIKDHTEFRGSKITRLGKIMQH